MLRLLCLNIPNYELNLIRSQDMLSHILEAKMLTMPQDILIELNVLGGLIVLGELGGLQGSSMSPIH